MRKVLYILFTIIILMSCTEVDDTPPVFSVGDSFPEYLNGSEFAFNFYAYDDRSINIKYEFYINDIMQHNGTAQNGTLNWFNILIPNQDNVTFKILLWDDWFNLGTWSQTFSVVDSKPPYIGTVAIAEGWDP